MSEKERRDWDLNSKGEEIGKLISNRKELLDTTKI